MSESKEHANLVKVAVNYARTVVPEGMKELVQYDSLETKRPPMIAGNYIPDVYFWNRNLLIIGEAKTFDDFERKHSQAQFVAYLQECKSFYGEAMLIVAIPWQLVAGAKNYFRRLKLKMNFTTPIIILNELGRRYSI